MVDGLTPRLALAASLAKGQDKVFDIGCDHAYLAIALVRGGASHVFASDVREGPLQTAKENIKRYQLEDAISTRLCSGLDGYSPEDAQCIIICGMGGDTIAQILSDAPWALSGEHLLILQPMTASVRLREFLYNNGCGIIEESLAKEGKRIYTVIAAKGGAPLCTHQHSFLFDSTMEKSPLFKDFLTAQRSKLEKILNGRAHGGLDATQTVAHIRIIEEHLAWL